MRLSAWARYALRLARKLPGPAAQARQSSSSTSQVTAVSERLLEGLALVPMSHDLLRGVCVHNACQAFAHPPKPDYRRPSHRGRHRVPDDLRPLFVAVDPILICC